MSSCILQIPFFKNLKNTNVNKYRGQIGIDLSKCWVAAPSSSPLLNIK